MTVGALNVTNTATVNGNLVVATAASVNVGSTANFSNVLPVAHNAYDFGAVAKQWANIHGAYIQPGLKVTFSSGVGFRYNGTLNYLYYDATQHGFNGILQANDAFQCVGTATLLGNLSLYNVVTFVAGSAASWSAIPTMLRHEIEGFGSGANQTVSFATGTLTSGAIVNVKYVAPGYHAVIQSDGPDVVLNVKKKFSTYLKGDDQSWRPLTPPPCSFVSDASGTSEAVVQFNDLLAAMRTMGMMLPS
jgi:hypothetical protein